MFISLFWKEREISSCSACMSVINRPFYSFFNFRHGPVSENPSAVPERASANE